LKRAGEATVKKIRFAPKVPAEVGATDQHAALGILWALHCEAETGKGRVMPLSGEFEGLLRLRGGNPACCTARPKIPLPYIASVTGEMLTG
jgi:hypothetical protein